MAGSASRGYMGFGVQSVPETSVAPSKFLPVKDVNFPVNIDFISNPEIRGNRQAVQKFDGPVTSSASFSTSFYPSLGMGVLLRALFGTVTSEALAPSLVAIKHTFLSTDADLPYLSIERSDTLTNGTGLLHERLAGCKVESMAFSCAFGEDVDVSIEAMGLGFPEDPATKPASFTYPAVDPFLFTGASVLIDGVENLTFKSIDFDFTNTLEAQQTLRKTRDAYRINEGGLDTTVSGTLAFEDNDLYEKFRNSEYLEIQAMFESVGEFADETESIPYSATFTWPRVKVSQHDTPMNAGETMEVDVEFEVSFDNATGTRVEVELVNLDAVGTYNT